MSRTVKVFATDDAGVVTTTEVDFIISDAIDNLISQGVIVGDSDGIFFQRQLEYIQAQSYDVLYPELMARQIFALNTEGGEGINQITYRSYDKRGETAIIAGKATDLPRGDISGKEFTINISTLGNAFGYSRQEIAAAKLTGMPLEARKAEATRRSYEEKVNQLVWFGDEPSQLQGFFNGPKGSVGNEYPAETVTRTLIADAGTNQHSWYAKNGSIASIKTPDQVIADLTAAVTQMYEDTTKIFRPDCILCSVRTKMFLMNTPRSLQSDKSIMTWFCENNMFITSPDQFKDVNELENIYADRGDITVDFDESRGSFEGFSVVASGSDNLRIREPFPYMHLPVQYKGLEFEINAYGRFGGLEMIRPAAIQHFFGVTHS